MNRDLMLKILPEIERIAALTTRDKYMRDELHQELFIACHNSPKIEMLQEEGKLSAWLRIVARNLHLQAKQKNHSLPTPIDLIEETNLDAVPEVKTFDEMLSVLTEYERMWITIYIDCDFNMLELQRRTKITRQHAKKRINQILKRWKHLDIYLQPQP